MARDESKSQRSTPRPDRLDTTSGGHLGCILRLAVPAVASSFLFQFYGLNDMFWLGRLSTEAQSAVGACLILLIMHFSFAALVSIGTSSLIAQYTGAGRREEAARTSAQALSLGMLISVCTAGAFFVTLGPVFDLMSLRGVYREHAGAYLGIILLGNPVMFGVPVVEAIFRGRGDTRTPFFLQLMTVAVNFIANPLLITGELPVPSLTEGVRFITLNSAPMGVAGAALATVLSRAVGFALGLFLLLRGRLGFVPKGYLPLSWSMARRCFSIGLPSWAGIFSFAGIYVVIIRIANDFVGRGLSPQVMVDGFMIGLRGGETITYSICYGFSLTATTLVGQNVGAGKLERASALAWKTAGLSVSVLIMFAAWFWWAPETLVSVFAPNDPAAVAAACGYLRVVALAQLFLALETAMGGAFVGAGNTVPGFVVTTLGNLLRIPFGAWAGYAFVPLWGPDMGVPGLGAGISGLWIVLCCSSVFKGSALAGWFLTGRWKVKGTKVSRESIEVLEPTDRPAPAG